MDLFYDPRFSPELPILNKEESHHCLRALRHKIGDEIQITNGSGSIWEGTIEKIDNALCTIDIDLEIEVKAPPVKRSVAISPTKSTDRFEWFIEKATELGVSEIYPVLCSYSERKSLNEDRISKKMISAIKQSQNPFLPKIHSLQSIQSFLRQLEGYPNRLLGNMMDHMKKPSLKDSEDAIFLIGPEGGFTEEEITQAQSFGFQEELLGRYILRTETAGIVSIQYLFMNV